MHVHAECLRLINCCSNQETRVELAEELDLDLPTEHKPE